MVHLNRHSCCIVITANQEAASKLYMTCAISNFFAEYRSWNCSAFVLFFDWCDILDQWYSHHLEGNEISKRKRKPPGG